MANKALSKLTLSNRRTKLVLLKVIRDLDKSNRTVTIEYRDQNTFNIDTPETNWRRSEVNHSVIDYPVNWQIQV